MVYGKATRMVAATVVISSVVVMFLGLFANDAEGQIFRRYSVRRSRTVPKKAVPQETKLIAFVKYVQSETVRPSNSDFDCFTDVDLREFRSTYEMIAESLHLDEELVKLVGEIRPLGSSTKKRLFAKATATYKPTWRQLGRISSRGQTVAGQRAERMIASVVVSTVKKMLTKPQSQLEADVKRARDADATPPAPAPR